MAEIEIKYLNFSYDGKRKILTNICFSAEKSETVGLVGANGAGKSTLLKLLAGLETDYDGEISLCGIVSNKKNIPLIRKKLGYVFQDSESQLFMSTVFEDAAFGPRNSGCSEEETEERVIRALEMVHISDLRDRQIYRMSGGQKKLAAIASVLSMQPEVLLFDEPTAALDPKNRRHIINLIGEIGGTKIIASHDLDMILDTCERTILISGNKIAADGKSADILTNQRLLEENDLELPLSVQK